VPETAAVGERKASEVVAVSILVSARPWGPRQERAWAGGAGWGTRSHAGGKERERLAGQIQAWAA
jgi:hypothetical protein